MPVFNPTRNTSNNITNTSSQDHYTGHDFLNNPALAKQYNGLPQNPTVFAHQYVLNTGSNNTTGLPDKYNAPAFDSISFEPQFAGSFLGDEQQLQSFATPLTQHYNEHMLDNASFQTAVPELSEGLFFPETGTGLAPEALIPNAFDTHTSLLPTADYIPINSAERAVISDILKSYSTFDANTMEETALLAGIQLGKNIPVVQIEDIFLADNGVLPLSDDALFTAPQSMTTPENNFNFAAPVEPQVDFSRIIQKRAQSKSKTLVDPDTGKPSLEPNAVSEWRFNSSHKFDPITGEVSTAPNAITITALRGRRRVDPITGKLSTAPNAISQHVFYKQRSTGMHVVADVGTPHQSDISYPDAAAVTFISNATSKPKRTYVKAFVDPVTGAPSKEKDAITLREFNLKHKFDPHTGKVSTAKNAITHSSLMRRRKVDPVTGEVSRAANAITQYMFYENRRGLRLPPTNATAEMLATGSFLPEGLKKKTDQTVKEPRSTHFVDPITGQPSSGDNAIEHHLFYSREKVDPLTGKPSNQDNAISRTKFQSRQKVDPVTGKRSTAENAISRTLMSSHTFVDPITGKRSDRPDAIKRGMFNDRKMVDPITGKPSNEPNAIKRSKFHDRKLVHPETGKRFEGEGAIHYAQYRKRKHIDPDTGLHTTAANAVSMESYKYRQKRNALLAAQAAKNTINQ